MMRDPRHPLLDGLVAGLDLIDEAMAPKVRPSDPPTSHAAAKAIEPHRKTQRDRIWWALQKPGTCSEVCDRTNLKWSSASTRLSEMIVDGDVVETGITRHGQRVVVAVKSAPRVKVARRRRAGRGLVIAVRKLIAECNEHATHELCKSPSPGSLHSPDCPGCAILSAASNVEIYLPGHTKIYVPDEEADAT